MLEARKIKELVQPPNDIELIAKYIYGRKLKAGKVHFQAIKTYAHQKDGLRACFVGSDGKMRSFNEMNISTCILSSNVLGFSSYLSDRYFLSAYLYDVAHKLNLVCKKGITDDICNQLEDIKILDFFKHLSTAYLPTDNIDLSTHNDSLAFLYDILCQRDEIFAYTKKVEQFVDNYLQTLKSTYNLKNSTISNTFLYSAVFYCLYQMDENFFYHWKNYFSIDYRKRVNAVNDHTVDDRDFEYFKRFGKTFTKKLNEKGMKQDFNLAVGANSSYAVLYPFLVFIEKMQREMRHIKNEETLDQFFIRYLSGGRVLATSLATIPEIILNTGEKADVHKIIDAFRYIDLSDSLLKGKHRRSRFRGYNTFYLIIYKMLIKSWNYYLKVPIDSRTRCEIASLLREHFPCDMFLLSRPKPEEEGEPCSIKTFFDNNEPLISTHPFYTQINNIFLNKTKSWLKCDVVNAYSSFVYCYINELDCLIDKLNEDKALFRIRQELIANLAHSYKENEFSREVYYRGKKFLIETFTNDLFDNAF